MNIAEILRSLADLIDAAEQGRPLTWQSSEPGEGNSEVSADVNSDDTNLDPNPIMVPPLQQRIELDKRAVDVDNHFDDLENKNSENNELDQMKKIAGILGFK